MRRGFKAPPAGAVALLGNGEFTQGLPLNLAQSMPIQLSGHNKGVGETHPRITSALSFYLRSCSLSKTTRQVRHLNIAFKALWLTFRQVCRDPLAAPTKNVVLFWLVKQLVIHPLIDGALFITRSEGLHKLPRRSRGCQLIRFAME